MGKQALVHVAGCWGAFSSTLCRALRFSGFGAVLTNPVFEDKSLLVQPLRINGVKVYTENVDKRQIILDLQVR